MYNNVRIHMFGGEIVGTRKIASRIVSIDYLKAIAVILVILTHSLQTNTYLKIGGPFWIDMSVPIFIIISGFTNAMSSDKHGINTLKEYFNMKSISSKLSRLMFPYLIIVSLEVLIYMMQEPKSLLEVLVRCIIGGWGPGSYYIPILIQLLIIFPFIYLLFKKLPFVTIALCLAVHLSFDIISNISPLSSWSLMGSLYRLLILRYLTPIVMGVVLYHYKDKIMKMKYFFTVMALLSIIYIWVCNYNGYVPVIFEKWTTTSLPTVFWAFGLVALGFKYLESNNKNWLTGLASLIGKSSYHIFLVQMVYFQFIVGVGKHNYLAIIDIMVCCIIGISFYFIETNIKDFIKKKKISIYN